LKKIVIISSVSVVGLFIILFAVMASIAHFQNDKSVEAKNTTPGSSATVNSNTGASSHTDSSSSSSGTSSAIDFDHFKLHDSTLPLPDATTCKQAQKRALSGLGTDQVKTVQTQIHETHLYFEMEFVDENMVKRLRSPSSQYWEAWEHLGTIQYPGSVPIYNETDGDTVIADLEKVRVLEKDPAFQSDIVKMQELVRQAVQNHDLTKFVELHQMLHDFDYWVVNYPIYYPKLAPPD